LRLGKHIAVCSSNHVSLKIEKAINMGLRDFLTQCARTLKLAIKPGRSELWLSIKICMLGIGAIGIIGFIVKLLSSLLQPGTSAA
jgi:protein translocase SEC61 complex gamma subunit